MSVECVAFIATSVDGYIAKVDGDIEWLHHSDYVIEGEDFGYMELFHGIDALIMGRNTYDLVASFEAWPYEGKPVFVLTSRSLDVPENLRDKVFVLSGSPEEILHKMQDMSYRRIYVDGGKTIQQFISARLLNEITITRLPILLGNGIPLFGELPGETTLKHVVTRSYENGFVQSVYAFAS